MASKRLGDSDVLLIDPSVLEFNTFKNNKFNNSFIENYNFNNINTIILKDIIFSYSYESDIEFLNFLINKIKNFNIKYLQISGIICHIYNEYLNTIFNSINSFIQKIYNNTNIKSISLIDLKQKITYCAEYGLHEDTYKTKIEPFSEENISDITNFLIKKLTKFINKIHIYNERHNKEMPPLLNLQVYDNKYEI